MIITNLFSFKLIFRRLVQSVFVSVTFMQVNAFNYSSRGTFHKVFCVYDDKNDWNVLSVGKHFRYDSLWSVRYKALR